MTRSAWAKVNLYLHVTGRRDDGYHQLDSLIVFAGIADDVRCASAADLGLEIGGPRAAEVPGGADNLALAAARNLAAAWPPGAGARISLDKRLPVAAGLGGGSADAAATLHALIALWGLAPPPAALQALALDLGADVPVCLFGRPAFVGGIGERIERAPPLPAVWLVLAHPGIALSTTEVFAARAGGFAAPGRWREVLPDPHALAEKLAVLGNDLEAPARALVPEIDALLDRLAGAPGALLARMSGSGATCFALFAEPAAAAAAAAAIAAERPDWWTASAPVLHGPLDRSRAG